MRAFHVSRRTDTRSGSGRLRVVLLVAAVAAGVLSGQSAATGAEVQRGVGTTPTITAPTQGTVVTSPTLPVSANSTATLVRFVLDSRGGVFTEDVDVVGGTASTDLPTSGIDGGSDVSAYDCTSPGVCGSVADVVDVTINLTAPVLTEPANNQLVGNSFVATAETGQGAIEFRVDGQTEAADTTDPFTQTISLAGQSEGNHNVKAVQCDASGTVCEGPSSNVRTVIKDTKAPAWSELKGAPDPFYPFRDHFKDSATLSAHVNENVHDVRVEIRKKDGPLVRTLRVGGADEGRVSVSWNGRTAGGDMVRPGTYTFKFVGTDKRGQVGKSRDRAVHVSDKRLMRQTETKTLSAKGSAIGNISGDCGGVYDLDYPQSRFGWPKGLGYYSRSKCNGTPAQDVAAAYHKVSIPHAVRYGKISISTYGAGAFCHAGPAYIFYFKTNNEYGHSNNLSAGVGWHKGGSADLENYYQRKGVYWTIATGSGNWYDVKEFRITYSYFNLRSP